MITRQRGFAAFALYSIEKVSDVTFKKRHLVLQLLVCLFTKLKDKRTGQFLYSSMHVQFQDQHVLGYAMQVFNACTIINQRSNHPVFATALQTPLLQLTIR